MKLGSWKNVHWNIEMIKVLSYSAKAPYDSVVINTTSRSDNWSKGLSPFFLGPVKLYDGYVAQNVENGWQFSKCYSQHLDANGNPSEKYWQWAKEGWADSFAHRYPMGKNIKPEFSWWAGEKLDYISARSKIYIPIYSAAVKESEAFVRLQKEFEVSNKCGQDLYLRDFDGYDRGSKTWEEIISDPNKKMGHAFVLAMLLEGYK